MKNTLLILALTFITLATVSAQNATAPKMEMKKDHKHEAHLKTMIVSYLALNEALYSDKYEDAKKHVTAIKNEVLNSKEMQHHSEHAEKHAKHHGEMVAAITKADAATDIKGIRAEYKAISEHLIQAVKNQGFGSLLYVQHCPMADGNKGADWLSTSKDVLNPYFGKMMLKCGSVKETLGKAKE